ncbi:MAG TPA: lysophospholipid acyltransferase family protein [Rhodocyclaceae bacterium]
MSLDTLVAAGLCGFVNVLTGVRAIWKAEVPEKAAPRIYYANHRSHGDFVLVWSSLPPQLRSRTRPVAGADYWLASALRRYIGGTVFRSVLIDRTGHKDGGPNPVEQMGEALAQGDSLILFPEGTRNLGDGLLPFKSGIYHLARANPGVELIPVWLENLGRVMPKGALIPVPLLCSVTFGNPLQPAPDESKDAFLARARDALLALAPSEE